MPRDLLLLLEPGFTDPVHSGERFVNDARRMLDLLAQRHSLPRAH